MGNLRNVRRAIQELGHPAMVITLPAQITEAERIILPGVGAFGEAMKRIDALDFRIPLLEAAGAGLPILGICLGMQLLFDRSEESPNSRGLGLLAGDVVRFPVGGKVPHIGWNDVTPLKRSPLFPDGKPGIFYFAHSFYVASSPATLARTSYGVEFSSVVGRDEVYGVQFHPEKSQADGMKLLDNFLKVPGRNSAGHQTG